MVQKIRTRSMIVGVLLRTLLFIGMLIITLFLPNPAHNILINIFGYQNPEGFFTGSWAEWSLAWVITNAFLSGIIFGMLGKTVDYIFILIAIAIALWEFTGTENVTLNIYLLFLAAIVISNAIGFGLKLARKKLFKKGLLGA